MFPVLIGSRALAFYNPALGLKDSTDWDVISDSPIEDTEWHSLDKLNNREMLKYVSDIEVLLPNGDSAKVMNMTGLAIIKRSHLHRDLSFQKHITHYHKFGLRNHVNWNVDLLERIRLTKQEFPQGNPNLNQSKEAFFDDAVKKIYDHDYLHELVAYYSSPLYKSLQRDCSKAWCHEDLWARLPHTDKIKCLAEEVYTIAIERFMVPNDWKYPSKLAYMKALNKVCTTLCSGWFRDFGIDNYPELVSVYDEQKFDNVFNILKKDLS